MPDKFIREIEEILEHSGGPGSGSSSRPSSRDRDNWGRSAGRNSNNSRLRRIVRLPSPRKIMQAGVGLVVVAVLLNAFLPGRISLAMWVGLILAVIAFGIFFFRPSQRDHDRWRDRPIDDDRSLLSDKIQRWFRGRAG